MTSVLSLNLLLLLYCPKLDNFRTILCEQLRDNVLLDIFLTTFLSHGLYDI